MNEEIITHSKRNKTLDVIRGLAIILVMVHHTVAPEVFSTNNSLDWVFKNIFSNSIHFLETGGWIAVDAFFVLSGFLVSGLLFSEYQRYGKIDVKRFLIRRGFKIYPAFVFFIGFTFVIDLLTGKYLHGDIYPIKSYVSDIFFLDNYLGGRWFHTWSLDIEEFFYLSLPILFYFLYKKNLLTLGSLVKIYIFLLFEGIIIRLIKVLKHPQYDFLAQYGRTHFRLDALFLGVLLCYIYTNNQKIIALIVNKKKLCLLISILVLTANFIFPREYNNWISVIMLAVNPLAFSILIVAALTMPNGLKSSFIELTGRHSYSIYLWHAVFFNYAIKYFEYVRRNIHSYAGTIHGISYKTIYLSYFILYFIISISFGITLGKLIEDPFIKLRNKFYPSRTKSIIIPK